MLAKSVVAVEQAESALRARDWDAAERHLDVAAADPPDEAAFLTLRAMVSAGRQDWPQAEQRWQRVIDAFPGRGDPYSGRATAIRMQGRVEECVDAYLLALEIAPLDLAPSSTLAQMLESLPPERAAPLIPRLREALDRHPDDPRQRAPLHWAKAKVALAAGELEQAVQALRVAQAAAINDPAIRRELETVEARLAATSRRS